MSVTGPKLLFEPRYPHKLACNAHSIIRRGVTTLTRSLEDSVLQDKTLMMSGLAARWPLLRPLGQRNYLLLWIGSVISYVGANLTFIAFPWLILKVSGDPLAVGGVMALAGIPRAALMLVGGAATDRFSPRTVLLLSTFLRLVLMMLMATLTWLDMITLWQVFVLAFLFGCIDAFFWPASSAILPSLLDSDLLPPGNALLQGSAQASLMLGPVLAGLIISLAPGDRELLGIALVFYLDVIGFVVSLVTLYLIRPPGVIRPETAFSTRNVLQSMKEGIVAVWQDMPVRLMTIVLAIFTLFFRGPHLVGIPVLAEARFEEGALAFGMIMSSFGLGALGGIIAAGSLALPKDEWLGRLLLLDFLVLGSTFLVYATTDHVELAMVATVIAGFLDGYIVVVLISWLQSRVSEMLIGRVMSVIMFSNNGLAPVSAAAAGWFLTVSLEGTFLGAGAVLVGLCLLGAMVPTIRMLGIPRSGSP